jgi:hypothetical protein
MSPNRSKLVQVVVVAFVGSETDVGSEIVVVGVHSGLSMVVPASTSVTWRVVTGWGLGLVMRGSQLSKGWGHSSFV